MTHRPCGCTGGTRSIDPALNGGFLFRCLGCGEKFGLAKVGLPTLPQETFARFLALMDEYATAAVLRERERCAKIALAYDVDPWKHNPASVHVVDMVSTSIAAAIRKEPT